MTDDAPEYVLGSAARELERLERQHATWLAPTQALWRRAGFAQGHRLLDGGCGPGFTATDLAAMVGKEGHVQGVDEAHAFIAHARERARSLGVENARFECADLAALDLDAQSLDGVFLRWVVSFLPQPGELFASVSRWLRPGGALVIMDYMHYRNVRVHPGGELFDTLFHAFDQANRVAGGSYDHGSRCGEWAVQNDLRIESRRSLVYLAEPRSPLWNWFADFCRVFAPRLPAMGLVEEGFDQQVLEALAWHERHPGAYFLTPPVLAMVARKAR